MKTNQYTSGWTEDIEQELVNLVNQGNSVKDATELLNELFNTDFTYASTKSKYQRVKDKYSQNADISEYSDIEKDLKFAKGKGTEITPDGTHKSDKLLRMSEEQAKDEEYLLNAHGYDKKVWAIESAKNNIWNVYSKQDGVQVLYSSKITVKKIKNEFNLDRLEELLKKVKPKKPVKFKGSLKREQTYLEVPLFDLHFGISSLEYYEQTLLELLELLEKTYLEVVFVIGQDIFHNDNFKGTTANGTIIDKVDMEKAWDDAQYFYITLLDKALEKSPKVKVIYSKGNHDESFAWGFVKNLSSYYREDPRIEFDTRIKERKAFMLGDNFIGTTHGDKNRNNIAANFSVEFPEMWARAKTREVHMGHLHRKRTSKTPVEITLDSKGVIVRELGTGNEIDQYHDDNGFTLAHKEFEVFEYGENKKKHIHYV